MKKRNKTYCILIHLVCFLQAIYCMGQTPATNCVTDNRFETSIRRIDSIARTGEVASTFCSVYSEAMKIISLDIRGKDSNYIKFVNAFVASFSNYFLKSYYSEKSGQLPASSSWKAYYDHPNAKNWQLVIAGTNAHINSDMWHSLIDNFTEEDIRANKKNFLTVQKSITKLYMSFFDSLNIESPLFRTVNKFTKGIPGIIGIQFVNKWRHRQIKLAILFYHNPERFEKLEKKISSKKLNNDKWVFERLN